MVDKFPLVYEENCNYGFRRNMFGLRPIGIAVSVIAAVALGLALFITFSAHEGIPTIAIRNGSGERGNACRLDCLGE